MDGAYCYELEVPATDIDEQGHANNVAFLRWAQDAAVAHSSGRGWTPEDYRASGSTWVARSHHIRYRRPALQGDRVQVRTWVESFSAAACVRRYQFVRVEGETVLAEARTEWAFVDLGSGRPKRLPAELIEAFRTESRAD